MPTMTHRSPRTELTPQPSLDHLLRQHGAVLRHRKQTLLDNEPSEISGVTDDEERSMGSEAKGIGFSVLELTSRTVQNLELALRRQATGELGLCADCGAAISKARLHAMPFAALCLDCQEKHDGDESRAAGPPTSAWQERNSWAHARSTAE
jgi:RNA polymerase-binding transcription factor DksA